MPATGLEPTSAEGVAHVVAIALDAGRAIMAVYAEPFDVATKADRSPVTAADHAAHRVIVDALAAAWPDLPVVSEEGEIPAAEVRLTWRRYWLVDPLDGTKEFVGRNGEFTVNVALIEDGVPVVGVVHAPAIGLTYWAARGLGAWRRDGDGNGDAERITSRAPLPGQALVVVESRSHPSAALEAWIARTPVARRVQVGSSLKLCWVADGRADVYPRLGPTMEWDVAAGDCVFRNAGDAGDGGERASPLTYGKPDLRNDGFVLGLRAGPHAA
jgi:3'(2'), 5'-bisphosphate nucleotidase